LSEWRGSGSASLDGMGASGAPMTPRRRRRSDRRNDPPAPEGAGAEAMDGVRVRWPRTQPPNRSRRPESSASGSPAARSSASGPSMSGARASPPGRRLPDRATSCSPRYCCSTFSGGGGILRRRGISILAGDTLLAAGAGDLPLDRDGERPRTTSSLSALKNPGFLSFSIPAMPPPVTRERALEIDQ
jgi:hypothetical protein